MTHWRPVGPETAAMLTAIVGDGGEHDATATAKTREALLAGRLVLEVLQGTGRRRLREVASPGQRRPL